MDTGVAKFLELVVIPVALSNLYAQVSFPSGAHFPKAEYLITQPALFSSLKNYRMHMQYIALFPISEDTV